MKTQMGTVTWGLRRACAAAKIKIIGIAEGNIIAAIMTVHTIMKRPRCAIDQPMSGIAAPIGLPTA
jgi:hypothetical protein